MGNARRANARSAPRPIRIVTPSQAASVATVVEIVADVTGISAKLIMGRARPYEIALARHATFYTLRAHTAYSLPDIAASWRYDHTSVLFGVNRIAEILETKPRRLADFIGHMERILRRAPGALRAVATQEAPANDAAPVVLPPDAADAMLEAMLAEERS